MRLFDEIQALEDEILDLGERVDMIQAQLGDPDGLRSDGTEMSDDEFADWRQRAKYALAKAITERRRANVKLKRMRWQMQVESAERIASISREDTVGLLLAVVGFGRWALARIAPDEVPESLRAAMTLAVLALEEEHGLIAGRYPGQAGTGTAIAKLGETAGHDRG